MYTAPPGPDDEQSERTEREEAAPDPDCAASTTDANWTGDVPADD